MRILHFSDPHITVSLRSIPIRKWFGKRLIGGINLLAGRRHLFANAAQKLAALDSFKNEHQVDLVVCTGDYTALGLSQEYVKALHAVKPLMDAPLGYVNVPGNHDLYAHDTLHDALLSKFFSNTLQSDLPEFQVDGYWPLVRLVGDKLAVIAVNSARPNPQPWRSSGRIPDKQLTALAALLSDKRVAGRLIFIITHYAPLLADTKPDSKLHGLDNGGEFLSICASSSQTTAILCGHVHQCYHVSDPATNQDVFCAGSVTMQGKEGFWLFDVQNNFLQARMGQWNGFDYVVNDNDHPVITMKLSL